MQAPPDNGSTVERPKRSEFELPGRREAEGWRKTRNHSWRTVQCAPPLAAEGLPPSAEIAHVTAVPGLVHIRGAVPADECDALVRLSEHCGYDNAHHSGYQDLRIDKQEEKYRSNDRVVYQASGEECDAIFQRLKPALPAELDARAEYYTTEQPEYSDTPPEEYGVWRPDSVNDMWRFYRYDARLRQQFPVHRDNMTSKRRGEYASWMSVLIYLSEGFQGGGTLFFNNQYEKVHEVVPRKGDVAIFFHHGLKSPLHAGAMVEGSEGLKYVLRTDVMLRATVPAKRGPTHRLSPPYDDTDSDDG
eukprot:TRINITY_DN25279_c0_g1_i1.p1 TRINITY_DN25279_c0_g1~~TRINITY_DN25279_c0_g1_i1.p1  ORF type:complete len:303 (+),score=71.65 TRINITY_DN25279_c0_g1_i1:90-998(+)